MTSIHLSTLSVALLALLTTGVGHAQDVLIYRGDTFAQHAAPNVVPLYQYERRVTATTTGLSAAHITHNPKGEQLIAETAQYAPDYALQRFEVANKQGGFNGTVEVSAGGRP